MAIAESNLGAEPGDGWPGDRLEAAATENVAANRASGGRELRLGTGRRLEWLFELATRAVQAACWMPATVRRSTDG